MLDRVKLALQFGENVRKHRLAKGLKQQELADRAGIHRTYLSDIERGERNVTLTSIVSVAEALDIPISVLTEGLQTAKPGQPRTNGYE